MSDSGDAIGGFVVLVILVAAVTLVIAYPFMWIWNYAVVGALTIAKPIGYWVAFWLQLFVALWLAGSSSSEGK